jgi:hypothetical protein
MPDLSVLTLRDTGQRGEGEGMKVVEEVEVAEACARLEFLIWSDAHVREMNNFYTEKKSVKNTTAATIDKRRSHAIDVSDSNASASPQQAVLHV